MSKSFDDALLATACALYRASNGNGRSIMQRWARHASIAPFVNYRLCGEHSDEFGIEQPHVGEECLICHAEATRPESIRNEHGECLACGFMEPGDPPACSNCGNSSRLVADHLSELTPDDTPESAMRKADDLVARQKFMGLSERLGGVRAEWQLTKTAIAASPTRHEREDRCDKAFRHLRILRKLRKDMVAEARTVPVGPLLVEADALKDEMEQALAGEDE